ncbi:MAG: hypothetical protein F4Y80_06125 [Caldilineaceae bacterium SB0665_bin_21]|nr:hypothetical protein [Caldilineaceae bacterium SB0665_bin_21]MYA04605.1 hypothetical protein [Caldilineaceae bacterium SB0664_bin_22]MYC61226.1 hypothetical protein [Caldilineaceae bacterium SB0661_bin_34]
MAGKQDKKHKSDFAKDLEHRHRPGLVAELWEYIRVNKKWWLAPIVALLLFISGLAALAGTAVAPFIYTLF